MRISKLFGRIVTELTPSLYETLTDKPTPQEYKQIAITAIGGLVKAFNDEWVAENPHDKPPIELPKID